jgi:hypothetical protein
MLMSRALSQRAIPVEVASLRLEQICVFVSPEVLGICFLLGWSRPIGNLEVLGLGIQI